MERILNGKVAVVTGGTRGIGYAIVKNYLEAGAKVVLFSSSQETALTPLSQIRTALKPYAASPQSSSSTSATTWTEYSTPTTSTEAGYVYSCLWSILELFQQGKRLLQPALDHRECQHPLPRL